MLFPHTKAGAAMTKLVSLIGGGLGTSGRAYWKRRYTILFYTLLLTLVMTPLITTFELTGALFDFLLVLSLLAAVLPVDTALSRRVVLPVAALFWLARPLTVWFDHPLISAVTLGLWTLMGLIAAAVALRFAMSATRVDGEHLYAALSAYLLAGIFFGLFYWVLEQIRPGTFTSAGEFSRMSAFYFSFVTLATVGYGDIVPRTDVARGLAIVEGVGGQLFLAVMVARLVSLYGRGKGDN
jgi:hypothetical protein